MAADDYYRTGACSCARVYRHHLGVYYYTINFLLLFLSRFQNVCYHLLCIYFYFFKKDQIQDCEAAMRAERMRRTTDNDSLFSCGGLSSSDRCKGLNVASGTTVCCLRPSCQQHTTQRVRICIYPSVIIVINTIRSSSIQRS